MLETEEEDEYGALSAGKDRRPVVHGEGGATVKGKRLVSSEGEELNPEDEPEDGAAFLVVDQDEVDPFKNGEGHAKPNLDGEEDLHHDDNPGGSLTIESYEDEDTPADENDPEDKQKPVVDMPRQRDYQWRLERGDNSFKEMYGVTPETISEGITYLMDVEVFKSLDGKPFGENFKRFSNNDVRNLFLKVEFAQSGFEAYLRELQERAEQGGEDGEAAESMLCHLEETGIHQKLLGMRGFTRELRLCYENGCTLRDPEQAERIFKKHLYRAYGIHITASKDQDVQIAAIQKGEHGEEAQALSKKLEGQAPEGDISFRTVGGRDLYKWSRDALPKGAYALLDKNPRIRKGLKYVSKPLRMLTNIVPGSPLQRFIPGYAYGFLKDKWSDSDDKEMTIPGFARPQESAHRYNKSKWSFKWCADFMFPAPSIKLNGRNGGGFKVPFVSASALEWAKENPEKAEGKSWYKNARNASIDFVDTLIELGRARTPGDAFKFTGDPNLQDQMMLAVKMRAVATNEVFYINVGGTPVRVGPEPPIDQLDPSTPEGQLFSSMRGRTHDISAMNEHYTTLRYEFVEKGKAQTNLMMKDHNREKFDVQEEEAKLLELSGHTRNASKPSMRR